MEEEKRFLRALLSKFAEMYVWSQIQELFYQLGLSKPREVQEGGMKILMDHMTPSEAQALLSTYHDGKLETVLNKVCNNSGLFFKA